MNKNQSFLVNAEALCSIFIQSTIGTYMVNKALQQIMPLTVEMFLLFACGCIGVEFGFPTACLIKASFTCSKFLSPPPHPPRS